VKPGSAGWLLKHELRLFLYGAGSVYSKGNKTKRRLPMGAIVLWLVMTVALHGIAWALLRGVGGSGVVLPPQMPMLVTGVCFAVFTLMLSFGLRASVEVLFQRGDLDLLLSSPLSSLSIFTVRLAAVVVAVAAMFLFFLAPVANVGLMLGQYHWLTIYPVVLGMALVAASLAILATLLLVRLFGARRTRVLAQVLGAVAGAFMFLASQAYSPALRSTTQGVLVRIAPLLEPGALLGPDSMIWLPGHAVLGAPWAALAMGLIGIAAFAGTVRLTHRFFVHGLQQAASQVRTAAAPAGGVHYRFGRGLFHTVVIKEWRLIARDPQLISQVLMQLLYMLPMCFALFSAGGDTLPRLSAAITFLAGSLTGSLAWIIIAAEDAPDLLQSAPGAQGVIRRAKLASVVLPTLALMAVPVAWTALRHPLVGAIMTAAICICVAGSASLVLWGVRPAKRSVFKSRGKGNFVNNIFELLNGVCWGAVAFMTVAAVSGSPSRWVVGGAFIVAAIGVALLLAGWLMRQKSQ
jgi:ABC-2 type transport system permease protein